MDDSNCISRGERNRDLKVFRMLQRIFDPKTKKVATRRSCLISTRHQKLLQQLNQTGREMQQGRERNCKSDT